MNFLRKLLLVQISLPFTCLCLWSIPSYSIEIKYPYCHQNELLYRYSGIRPSEKLSTCSENFPLINNLHCLLVKSSNETKENPFPLVDLEDDKDLSIGKIVAKEKHFNFNESKFTYQCNKSFSEFHSIFLFKSSFLL